MDQTVKQFVAFVRNGKGPSCLFTWISCVAAAAKECRQEHVHGKTVVNEVIRCVFSGGQRCGVRRMVSGRAVRVCMGP